VVVGEGGGGGGGGSGGRFGGVGCVSLGGGEGLLGVGCCEKGPTSSPEFLFSLLIHYELLG